MSDHLQTLWKSTWGPIILVAIIGALIVALSFFLAEVI